MLAFGGHDSHGDNGMSAKRQLDEQVTQAPNTSEHGQDHDHHADDPKRDPHPPGNTEKNPDDWVTGDEPMTGAQGSYLKTLSEQAHKPDMFEAELTKADASKRIDALRKDLAL